MISNDNTITLTLIYEGLQDLRNDVIELKADVAELKADVTQLKADVAELKADVKQLNSRVTKLEQTTQTEIRMNEQAHHFFEFSMGIGFAAVAIVVAFASIFVPSFREHREYKREMQSMIDKSINRALLSLQR